MRASVTGEGIGTNLSSEEGECFNPSDEKRNVRRKMAITSGEIGKWDDEERVIAWRSRRSGGGGGGEQEGGRGRQ